MRHITTEVDRKHFCTYDQAWAALIDNLPFRSNGHTHMALNLTTGHKISCADAYIAFGYVAGSGVLFPQWSFVIEMGSERVGPFQPHPLFKERLKNPRWREHEEFERNYLHEQRQLHAQAKEAYDAVISAGFEDRY